MYHIVKDIPDRKVAGVYALIDEDGKMYIGSSKDIQNRIFQHESCMSRVLKHNSPIADYSQNLGKAVLSGHTFKAVILEEVESPNDRKLKWAEQRHIQMHGGYKNLYNSISACSAALPVSLTAMIDNDSRYRCSGILAITNIKKMKTFISMAYDFKRSIIQLLYLLSKHKHTNAEFQQDYDNGDPMKIDILHFYSKEDSRYVIYKYMYLIGEEHLYNIDAPSIRKNRMQWGKQYLEEHPILFS